MQLASVAICVVASCVVASVAASFGMPWPVAAPRGRLAAFSAAKVWGVAAAFSGAEASGAEEKAGPEQVTLDIENRRFAVACQLLPIQYRILFRRTSVTPVLHIRP